MRYTLKDITDLFAKKSKLPQKKAEAFAKAFFRTIVEGLEQDNMTKVKNFGTFKIVAVSDRQSVDVNTGQPVLISGHNKVSFTPDEKFKSIVNRPFSQFETIILNEETDTDEIERVKTPVLPDPAAKEETASPDAPSVQQTETDTHTKEVLQHTEETAEKPDTRVSANEEAITEEAHSSPSAPVASENATPRYAAGIMQVQEKPEKAIEPTEEVSDAPPPAEETEQTISEKPSLDKGKWKIAAAILGLLLLAGIFFWVVNRSGNATPESDTTVAATDSAKQVKNDSLAGAAQTEVSDGITIGKNGEKLQLFDTKDSRDIVNNFEIVGDLEEYEFKYGDIIELIAKERYGDNFFVTYIYKHNNMKPYSHVSAGTRLKLPKLKRKE